VGSTAHIEEETKGSSLNSKKLIPKGKQTLASDSVE
jgi:hypothetical protein